MAEYKKPTPEQVNEVLRRIPTPSLRRAFFEGLKNPLWVEPLAKVGMFSDPPEPEKTNDGFLKDHYWPEIDYLIRVASASPKPVVDVLLKLADSNNAWVRRAVFAIGATIQTTEAVRLFPMVKSWKEGGFGWRVDPRDMVGFVVNLLQGGELKAGKAMANFLFRPVESENPHKPAFGLDEYWYQDGLPRVVEALGDEGLKTVLPWLEEFERHTKRFTDTYDITDISRESIRERGDHYPSIEHSLIDAVRDLASSAMIRNPRATVVVLAKSPMILSCKITLHATMDALRNLSSVPSAETNHLIAVAALLVADRKFQNDSFRIEFAELAREVALHRPAALESLTEFILSGPPGNREQLRDRLRSDESETLEDLDTRVEEVVDTWRHRWLSAIGSESIPSTLKPLLQELDTKRGVIESPLTPMTRVTSWSGPNSPISQDEMSVMSSAELVAHLSTWHDTGEEWGPRPSHEGQGRELSSLITTNPRAINGVDDLVNRLRPTYLRAILQGWEAAIKAGISLEWHYAANLICKILIHSNASPFPPEGRDFDDDVDLLGAKRAAVNLLEELAQKRENLEIPTEAQQLFADLLINEADSDSAWDKYDADESSSSMDPLTISLNWQWPTRVRGLLNLVLHGQDTSWYNSSKLALERELERVDRRGASRAIIGQELGRLLTIDPDWIKPRIEDYFGSANGISSSQQIALTTAIMIHHYHIELYELLAPAMLAAISLREPLISGWKGQSDPMQHIGEWAVSAFIRGHKNSNDPVCEAFFSLAEPKVRGAAIGRIAWSFMNAESVEQSIRDRFADFWDSRVQHVQVHPKDKNELDEFYWFVKSEKFRISWWLPRLKEAIVLDSDLASGRCLLGKQLADAADVDPQGALEVTQLLIEKNEDDDRYSWDLARNAVPIVIARSIASGNEQLKQAAIYFMNKLGENGNQNLEREVQEVLDGKITQDDISD
ncbi:hypothetical protein DFO58_0902 [Arthrobacter sp. AG1021]|uniref:hypothetical protein n=1 Tax=Arthrobacter sp. AG1021 TaxID=2183908 RepID=UPI000F2B9C6D|nr:hypothetical protein [Arthrobacter sp. AG1021]RKS22852.1 hypothetical protein DFO58_0902 [Arthrobacter sp. AG1021]